ncbi:disulfide isomerase [Metschnikowia bicuspidata var. bicuspidata NRRL YB-4993]|uniref:protein disulfide-isomerase n=1 Tax=Metschnikowia bicuspidata var. bicuspidata NRRL YB-4993 TaxID=869754 RepID=A0A1A0HEL6_9ASCO|nr:disulfide isomerase [Metschnikowia bicuspidata var. bicuspidata NRRL YB-4993]OBA22415.1 disulfide isomerase [Metschnikowia bicuspidata var. bicuspidata NRRL YB-4993]
MQFWKFSTLAIAALLASVSLVSAAGGLDEAAIASPDSAVLKLTAQNFKQTLEENPMVLMEFFAPWCGHCKTLGPQFAKAADELSESLPKVKLGQVNCVEEEELCRQHEIKGYPTMKLARGPYQQPDDYEGPRDSAGIVDYMIKMSQSPVNIVSDFTSFVERAEAEIKPFVVQVLPKAAHAAAAAFNETFGEIALLQRRHRSHFSLEDDTSIAELAKLTGLEFAADKAHYLLVHPGQFDDARVFSGDNFTHEEFTEWATHAQVPDFGDINRDTYMVYMGSTMPLGYYFYETPEQRAAVEAFFAEKGKELRGKIHFVGLDATQFGRHAEILNMDPLVVPLFAIQDNSNGRKYGINQVEHPSPSTKTIEEFIDSFLAGEAEPIIKSEPLPTSEDEDYDENVEKLVAHNYDDVLADESKNIIVEYFAPWCGHCKKLAPTWSELGAYYKENDDSVVVAKIDHTLNDVAVPHNIEGYPTVILYPANGEKDPKTGLRLGVVYNNARELESFKEFIETTKVSSAGNTEDAAEEDASVVSEDEEEIEEHDEL